MKTNINKVYHTSSYTSLALAMTCGILLFFGASPTGVAFLVCCALAFVSACVAWKTSEKLFSYDTGATQQLSENQHGTGNLIKLAATAWMCFHANVIALTGIVLFMAGHWLVSRNHPVENSYTPPPTADEDGDHSRTDESEPGSPSLHVGKLDHPQFASTPSRSDIPRPRWP